MGLQGVLARYYDFLPSRFPRAILEWNSHLTLTKRRDVAQHVEDRRCVPLSLLKSHVVLQIYRHISLVIFVVHSAHVQGNARLLKVSNVLRVFSGLMLRTEACPRFRLLNGSLQGGGQGREGDRDEGYVELRNATCIPYKLAYLFARTKLKSSWKINAVRIRIISIYLTYIQRL